MFAPPPPAGSPEDVDGLPHPVHTGPGAGGGPGGREGGVEGLSRGEGEGVAQGAAHTGALHHSLDRQVNKGLEIHILSTAPHVLQQFGLFMKVSRPMY